MFRSMICLAALLIATDEMRADPPAEELVEAVTAAITKHSPDAQFAVNRDGFTAKAETMMLTVHRRGKGGEIFPQTDQYEGPSHKGFMLHIASHSGPYQGAAVTPQTLQEPYFQTYIDSPPAGKDGHYFIHLSYGSRLNPELKKAIFEAIPRTKFSSSATNAQPSPPAK